jgi:phenylalanine-4-hydroxylase
MTTMSVAEYARDCAAQGLRGDYSVCRSDFTVAQGYDYSAEEQAVWRTLCDRQTKLTQKLAHHSYLDGVARLGLLDRIPDFGAVSEKLRKLTGWEIVAVPGLIPDDAFFTHLANRRFPVTVWLRRPEEFDYIVEPDVFHDFFGHVPLLFDRVYADHLYEYGKGGLKAMRLDAVKLLARLYWFTIEFGLMHTPAGVRAYGAGLLSSGGELAYCVEDPRPKRLPFDLERIMRTEYQIDRYQEQYFVIDSFEHLMRETAPDFTPIYARLRS